MPDDVQPAPGTPNPLRGPSAFSTPATTPAVSTPPAAGKAAPAPAPAGNSPFGSLAQYKHKSQPAEFVRIESVTGASIDGQGRLHTRKIEGADPEWSSPVKSLSKPFVEFGASVGIYWLGYGVMQLVLTAGAALLSGSLDQYSGGTFAAMLTIGPLFGVLTDFAAILNGGWTLLFGASFLLAEPFLFFVFFFSSTLRERLQCSAFMFGLVFFRVLILSFASAG